MTTRCFSEPRNAAFIGNATFAHLFFRLANSGNFGYGVNAIGKGFRRRRKRDAKRMACGNTALFHGGGCETWKTDDITGGINMRHIGLERHMVNLDAAPAIDIDPNGIQSETAHVARAARRIEQHIGFHQAAIGQADFNTCWFHRDVFYFGTQADGHAAVTHLVDEIIDQFAVHEIQYCFAGFNQGDRHVQRGKDRGIFNTDHATADHRQRAGQGFHVENFVTVKNAVTVERNVVGSVRARAHRNERIGKFDFADLTCVRRERGAVGTDKLGKGMNVLHRVAHELVLQNFNLMVEGLVQAGNQVMGRNILLHAVTPPIEAALAPARKVQHGFTQCLGGDGSRMHGNTTQPAALVHDQDGFAKLGGLHGGAAARGTAADNQHVVVVHLIRAPLSSIKPRSATWLQLFYDGLGPAFLRPPVPQPANHGTLFLSHGLLQAAHTKHRD